MRLISFLLSAIVLLSAATHAQTTIIDSTPGPGRVTRSAKRPQGVSSPVPAPLLSARKIFLSNGGAEAGLFPHPFTGTQDRGYGYLFNALQKDTHFEMVNSPAVAELVLLLELTAPNGSLGGDKRHGTSDALPSFKLTIFDRPSHYVLWTITQTVDQANLQKTHDKNFDDALDLLVKQWDVATGNGPPAIPSATRAAATSTP